MKCMNYILIFLLFCSVHLIYGDSYYSSFGLGIPQYAVSVASAGRGGAGIAVRQVNNLNMMNPSTLNLNGMTSISLDVDYQIVNNQFEEESAYTRNGNAAGFAFAVPVSQFFSAFAGLKRLSASRYMLSYRIDNELASYERLINGKGGLTAANAGFQVQVLKWLSISSVVNFNFGTYSEIWETDFDENIYIDSSDDINSHIYGLGYSLGFYMEPYRFLTLGFVFNSASSLSIESQIIPGNGVALEETKQTSHYPRAWGAGFSVPLKNITFAGDIYCQQWSNYSIDGNEKQGMTDYWRASAGLEYLNTSDIMESYYKRVYYRFGGHFAQLPFLDPKDQAVSEMSVSVGFGFPFRNNQGKLDLSLEYGKRYESISDGYRETIYRLTGSITSSEKWFQRLF